MINCDIKLERVSKSFGDVRAVENVTLQVRRVEFLTLLGPSGCGKTTTLNMIAGFVHPDSGSILIRNIPVTELPPYERDTGMVFQSYALFPHMTVFENVAFGLRMRKLPEPQIKERVGDVLECVRLTGYDRRYPRELSGGQQQRVALARALVVNPAVLLLDERRSYRAGRQPRGNLRFSDHALRGGLYRGNQSPERSGKARGRGGLIDVQLPQTSTSIRTRSSRPIREGAEVTVSIRPEKCLLQRGPSNSSTNQLTAVIRDVLILGSDLQYELLLEDQQAFTVKAVNTDTSVRPAIGETVKIAVPPHHCLTFSETLEEDGVPVS